MERDNPILPSSLDWKMFKWKRSMDNVLEDKVQAIGDILNDLNVGGPSSIGSRREYFPDLRSTEWASSKITNPTSSISSQKFLESGKHSYQRGTAVRMLKVYLADLVKFNISIDDSFQQRVEENQAFLKELDETNQREPNRSLTSSERRKFSLILEDYQTALTTVLEDQRHEEIMPVDVDSVDFQDVAEGIPLHLYEAVFSGDGYMESIINALDLCETQVREFKKLLLVVRVFRHQCMKLVETLEPTAVNVFGRCHKVMGGLQKLEAGGSGNRSKSYERFCFESLVRLARNFQSVVDLLKKCASENLPKTTLEVADLPSPTLMSRRWSKFSLAVRNCEWGMDLVEFAFYTLETLLAGGTHIPDDISFKWCEEECRTVLQSEGRLGKESMKLEKSVDHELEAQDLGDLIDQLRHLAEALEPVEYADLADSVLGLAGSEDSADSAHSADSAELGGLADPSDFIMQQIDAARGQLLSKVVFNRAKMANFLSEKLSGPIPHAEDLPWTFRVNPSTLKFREFLDSGGSGMVAEYMWLGESVAVKTVRSPGLTWQKFEEAAVLAVVQHPNVVRLIGCGFIDERNTGMLVMELMDHDLRAVIESKMTELGPESSPFITTVAIDIILQIAEAMRHLRNHRVLHRDLKTKNILVNIYKPLNPSGVLCSDLPHLQEEYVVKIIDFGVARCRPGSSWLHTRMEGTPRWMAPEVFHVQELDGTHEYQWSADVYSFAMTCYEILTGKLPFANYPEDAIPECAILAGMRPEGLDEAEVPDLLKTLVKQCWAADPGERPSFEEIVKSLWECRLEAILPVLEQPVASKPSVVFKDAILGQTGRPNLIGDKVLIDLTKDLLGVSSTGYVIRTNCPGMQGRAQPCALKRIDVMDSNGSDLARLSHPHVVQFIGHWIEEKSWFLIMELMDGDLAKLMANTKKPRASPFTLHVTVDLMLQIALGMRHLHEMGVSHPHLKCENVLYRAVIKTEAYQVGDVLVKLGGFGWSRPADVHSKNRDVVCFGQTCLEILIGNVNPETVSKSSIPETTPVVLKNCIVSCLDTQTTFANVVKELLRAKSNIVQCCTDETICSSEMIQTQSVPAKSGGSLDEIFTVHQLHPQSGDVSTSIRATLVFFHGFHKVPEEWRRTWMTRDNKLVWPQKWLPEDLSSLSIRVLSVSFDANSNVSNKYNRYEIGKNLVEGLILSPRWKLGEIGEAIFLIGHSFGGVLIKSFITEAQDFLTKRVQNNTNERVKCMKFLNSLAKVVFYSVPHAALAAVEFEHYISECRKVVPLQRSSFLHSLREDTRFIADMCKLSVDFESALPENVNVLAFLEGKPMSMKRVLVTEKSFEGLSRPWEWHKIEKDNHFEVSRPESKNHIGYKILLDHLLQYMTSNACKVKRPSLRVVVFAVIAARRLKERAKTSGVISNSVNVKRPSLRVIVFALVAIRKLKERVRVSEIGLNNLNAREPAKLPLGYYHRGTAIRMLRDYLSDLTTLKLPLDNNLQKCVDENRALLKEMSEAYQREPNSPLTLQERSKLGEMLKDYEAALSAVSEDQDGKEEVADVDDGEPVYSYAARSSDTECVKSWTSALGLCEKQLELPAMSDETIGGGMTSEQLLLICASAVEQNDVGTLEQAVSALRKVSSFNGEPRERVTAYFLQAILRRGGSMLQDPSFPSGTVYKLLNSHEVQWTERRWSLNELTRFVDITPYFRFGYTAANGAILEALEGMHHIHIIDFSTTHGMQWPAFIEALADRVEGPPHSFRLTLSGAAPPSAPRLQTSYEDVGFRLAKYARLKNVPFEFNVVHHDPLGGGELTASDLNLREGEALAVNFSLRLHYLADESIAPVGSTFCPRDELLHRIRGLNPAIVTLYEEDCDTTSPSLIHRVEQSFAYEWMPFDFLATFWPPGHEERREYEKNVGRKIENIVACEGVHRLERLESRRQWLLRMARLHFRGVALGEEVVAQLQEVVEHHNTGWGMKCDEEKCTQSLLWKGNCLTFASAWVPAGP